MATLAGVMAAYPYLFTDWDTKSTQTEPVDYSMGGVHDGSVALDEWDTGVPSR